MSGLDRRTMLKLLAAGTGTIAAGGSVSLSRATTASADATADRSLSEGIADYVVRARFEDLPETAIHKAKEQIAFFLGRALDNSASELASQMRRAVPRPSDRAESAAVIGDRLRLAAPDAAFANAMLFSGSLSSDDALECAAVYAGALTLPVALALSGTTHASGRELILALVLGHEVLGKLNRSALRWKRPLPCQSVHVFSGLGPITVAGRLLAFDREQMTHAVGAGAHLGLSLAENPMIHYYYGQIARHGTAAAQRVRAGSLRYSRTVLDGDDGLYRSLLGGSGELTDAIDDLRYEEILAAEPQHRLTTEHVWHDSLAASGLLAHRQVEQLLQLISRLEQVDDASSLVAAATPQRMGTAGHNHLGHAATTSAGKLQHDPARPGPGSRRGAPAA